MEVVNMVKKSKIDFVSAHQLSKTKLKKNTKNKPASKPNFSEVKTGHRTPDTEHLKKQNGPEGTISFGSSVQSLGFYVMSFAVFCSEFSVF
jgi:hypothetical protein